MDTIAVSSDGLFCFKMASSNPSPRKQGCLRRPIMRVQEVLFIPGGSSWKEGE
jgi:hypothetical protein